MPSAEVFQHDSMIVAWHQAAEHLRAGATPYVIVVTAGTAWAPTLANQRRLDEAADSVEAERPGTVAEMLIPKIVHLSTEDPQDAIQSGQRFLGRGRQRGLKFSGWSHTYFERITGAWHDRFGIRREIKNNRLLDAIRKINQWNRNSEAALYIHTDIASDNFRPRGSPCLQYVQFRAHGNHQLSVVGLYRAHDYTNKFLGNALGLIRLGEFVAHHTNRTYDGLAIISLHPFCDNRTQIGNLIENVGA